MRSVVRFENDRLRVLELRLPPGEKEPMHSHPAFLVIVLSPATMRMTSTEDRVTELDVTAGQVSFSEATTHAGENVGATELHELIVELKQPAARSPLAGEL